MGGCEFFQGLVYLVTSCALFVPALFRLRVFSEPKLDSTLEYNSYFVA
mgnify:CR=1 FL=1